MSSTSQTWYPSNEADPPMTDGLRGWSLEQGDTGGVFDDDLQPVWVTTAPVSAGVSLAVLPHYISSSRDELFVAPAAGRVARRNVR